MIRLLCVVLLAAGSLAAAPVPKTLQKSSNLMPLGAGWRWEYSTPASPDVVSETREIVSVEEKNGVVLATQKTSNTTQVFRQDADGVAVVRSGSRDYENPRFLLKPGMKAGDEWQWDAGVYVEQRTVGKAETIKVPAGTFEAVPLTYKTVQNGLSSGSVTVWYSAGVGLVRIDHDGQPSQVLKSFTKGGK